MNRSDRRIKSLIGVYEMYIKGDQIIICLSGTDAPDKIFTLSDVKELLKI